MSDVVTDPVAPASPPPAAPPTPADTSPLTISQARARLFARPRDDKPNAPPPAAPRHSAPAEAAPEIPSDEDEDAAPDTRRSRGMDDPTDADDPADAPPPVEPPRSWTKAEKDAFAQLPVDHQRAIADRAAKQEAEFRRGQNESVEKAKAAETLRAQAQTERDRAIGAQQQAMSIIQAQYAAEFADVKDWPDVQRMAAEDPSRYIRWEAMQKQHEALSRQTAAMQGQKEAEEAESFAAYVAEQDRLFLEKAPEFGDPKRVAKAREGVIATLKDAGLSEDEIGALWAGKEKFSLRDHRAQTIIRKAALYDAAQAAAVAAAKAAENKSTPPVLKPGTPPAKGEARAARLEALSEKLNRTGSIKDAWAYRQAQLDRGRRG